MIGNLPVLSKLPSDDGPGELCTLAPLSMPTRQSAALQHRTNALRLVPACGYEKSCGTPAGLKS